MRESWTAGVRRHVIARHGRVSVEWRRHWLVATPSVIACEGLNERKWSSMTRAFLSLLSRRHQASFYLAHRPGGFLVSFAGLAAYTFLLYVSSRTSIEMSVAAAH